MERSLSQVAERKDGEKHRRKRRRKGTKQTKREKGKKGRNPLGSEN
jgi:hypothetical protein